MPRDETCLVSYWDGCPVTHIRLHWMMVFWWDLPQLIWHLEEKCFLKVKFLRQSELSVPSIGCKPKQTAQTIMMLGVFCESVWLYVLKDCYHNRDFCTKIGNLLPSFSGSTSRQGKRLKLYSLLNFIRFTWIGWHIISNANFCDIFKLTIKY